MAIRIAIPRIARRATPVREEGLTHEQMENSRLTDDGLALRLQQECAELTVLYRSAAEFGCDPDRGFWLQLAEWPLPAGMNQATCPVIALLPRDYPDVAPNTFFLPADLTLERGAKPADLLPAEGDVVIPDGWQVCAVPAVRWRAGDDLDRILSALHAVLKAAGHLPLTLSGAEPVSSSL